MRTTDIGMVVESNPAASDSGRPVRGTRHIRDGYGDSGGAGRSGDRSRIPGSSWGSRRFAGGRASIRSVIECYPTSSALAAAVGFAISLTAVW